MAPPACGRLDYLAFRCAILGRHGLGADRVPLFICRHLQQKLGARHTLPAHLKRRQVRDGDAAALKLDVSNIWGPVPLARSAQKSSFHQLELGRKVEEERARWSKPSGRA